MAKINLNVYVTVERVIEIANAFSGLDEVLVYVRMSNGGKVIRESLMIVEDREW
jgi:hypothetical protein